MMEDVKIALRISGSLDVVLQDKPFARWQLGEQDFRLVSEGPDKDDVRLDFVLASAQK